MDILLNGSWPPADRPRSPPVKPSTFVQFCIYPSGNFFVTQADVRVARVERRTRFMRKIRFRAWDMGSGAWLEPAILASTCNGRTFFQESGQDDNRGSDLVS
jgi:hypothetical protein